jgi:hypothetical protein
MAPAPETRSHCGAYDGRCSVRALRRDRRRPMSHDHRSDPEQLPPARRTTDSPLRQCQTAQERRLAAAFACIQAACARNQEKAREAIIRAQRLRAAKVAKMDLHQPPPGRAHLHLVKKRSA